ncbi:MAG: nitroreductase family protein [Actinomycetota bacterium]
MSQRVPDSHLVHDVFVERTSTRSFTDQSVTDDELAAVFEAARWAPSWMNNQPWYFVYATEGADRTGILYTFLESNRIWAQNAPVAGLVIARTELEGAMARTRDFDVGIATGGLIIQAGLLGISVHLLGGIDVDAAHELTGADPAISEVICGFVMGRKGDGRELSEKLRAREVPSQRKSVGDFAHRGATLPS